MRPRDRVDAEEHAGDVGLDHGLDQDGDRVVGGAGPLAGVEHASAPLGEVVDGRRCRSPTRTARPAEDSSASSTTDEERATSRGDVPSPEVKCRHASSTAGCPATSSPPSMSSQKAVVSTTPGSVSMPAARRVASAAALPPARLDPLSSASSSRLRRRSPVERSAEVAGACACTLRPCPATASSMRFSVGCRSGRFPVIMSTPTRRSVPQFHREPPYSPRRWFARPGVLALTLVAVVTLAALAAYDGVAPAAHGGRAHPAVGRPAPQRRLDRVLQRGQPPRRQPCRAAAGRPARRGDVPAVPVPGDRRPARRSPSAPVSSSSSRRSSTVPGPTSPRWRTSPDPRTRAVTPWRPRPSGGCSLRWWRSSAPARSCGGRSPVP